MKIETKHCCQLMSDFLNDPRIPIGYSAAYREYYIKLRSTTSIQLMFYCPWCGVKLPKDLRDEFLDIFYDQLKLNLKPGLGTLETPGLPEEFKTDAWWKKRGL